MASAQCATWGLRVAWKQLGKSDFNRLMSEECHHGFCKAQKWPFPLGSRKNSSSMSQKKYQVELEVFAFCIECDYIYSPHSCPSFPKDSRVAPTSRSRTCQATLGRGRTLLFLHDCSPHAHCCLSHPRPATQSIRKLISGISCLN